jgi:DNA-directed RNA polymerase specialized sigma24 family protein
MQAQQSGQNQQDSYELFRRAIVERDEQAWIESATRYRPLLAAWASRCSASAALTESYDDLADQAFARAWSALSPERFASFPTLAALLAYMRACVTTTVIDHARSELSRERIEQSIQADEVATPEQLIMDQFQRQEVWRLAETAVVSEQERVVLRETFVNDLPPRAILRRYPDLFADAHAIYTTKRNLFDRLQRCTELRQVYQEWQGA